MLFGVENDNTSLLTNSNNILLANYEVTSAGSEVSVLPAYRPFKIRLGYFLNQGMPVNFMYDPYACCP